MPVFAYVDESYDLPAGCYILGAAIVDMIDAERIRADLRVLRYGTGKLHWKTERHDRRLELASTLLKFDVTYLVVIGRAQPMRDERARRKCLMALLPELARCRVDVVVLESRQRRRDEQDMALVAACCAQRLIPDRLRVTLDSPANDSLLWLADIICGVVYAAEHDQPEYLAVLGARVSHVTVDAE